MPYRCLRWWFSRDTPPIWNMRRTVCLQCHNDLQMVRVRPSDSSGFVVGRVWWFVRIFLHFHGVRACGARPVIARPRTHPCHREATHSPRHREATHSPRHREATYSPRHREAMHSPRHREAVRPWRSMTSCPHGLPRFARNDGGMHGLPRFARNDGLFILARPHTRPVIARPRTRLVIARPLGRGDPCLFARMDCRATLARTR